MSQIWWQSWNYNTSTWHPSEVWYRYDICIPRPSALPPTRPQPVLFPAKTVLAVGVEVLPRYPAAVLPLDEARIVAAAAILRRPLGKKKVGYTFWGPLLREVASYKMKSFDYSVPLLTLYLYFLDIQLQIVSPFLVLQAWLSMSADVCALCCSEIFLWIGLFLFTFCHSGFP